MAAKNFVNVAGKGVRQGDIFGYWELQAGDTAVPLICPRYNDKSVHIFGTWDGATVDLQATNDPALAVFEDACDQEGSSISQTADRKPWLVFLNTFALKPVITGGGANTSLKIVIVGRGGI